MALRMQRQGTPLRVFRELIDLTQAEMGERLFLDRGTYQSLELGPKRLRMTKAMAQKISRLTGLSAEWLLAGNPEAPMVDTDGRPYSHKTFNAAQNYVRKGRGGPIETHYVCSTAGEIILQIFSVLLGAYRDRKFAQRSAEIHKFLERMAEKFGRDQQFDRSTAGLAQMPFGRIEKLMMVISDAFDRSLAEHYSVKLQERFREQRDPLGGRFMALLKRQPKRAIPNAASTIPSTDA